MQEGIARLFPLLFCLLSCTPDKVAEFKTGADRLFEEPYISWVRGKRIGLITNATGVTSDLKPLAALLEQHREMTLAALFSPEHGISGDVQAGEEVTDGPRIFSLYGARRAPTPEMLRDIDVLIYDVQDVGARFYTFISTMFESMKAADSQGIPFIILDRPNPIDGTRVEGPVLEEGFQSFVGIHPLPIRYGMTPAELAGLLRTESALQLQLQIVPLQGWRRADPFASTGLQWINPSPNMPSLGTAMIYPGTCLIEGTNLSEGRGTTRPFELIGAPWLEAETLVALLNEKGLPGVAFRSQSFTPTFSKYQGESCRGVQVHTTGEHLFKPIEGTLYLLREVLNAQPSEFRFRDQAFDRLVGNSWVRQMLLDGADVEAIVGRWQDQLEAFEKRRLQYLLYP